MIELINANCLHWLPSASNCRMIFADPPDNIGLKYNGFKDKMSEGEYGVFMYRLLSRATDRCDVFWLSFNAKHIPLVGWLTRDFLDASPEWAFKPCVQTYTFGQNRHTDLGGGHRPLYRYMRKGTQLYPDAVRVPSWRQLNGDKRADPRGRVPLDVFDLPRVTGNSKQRRRFSPTQLHESLYERCIKLCCAPGDIVVDLFAGSGTLGRVADRCEVDAIMIEKSKETCEAIAEDQPETKYVR